MTIDAKKRANVRAKNMIGYKPSQHTDPVIKTFGLSRSKFDSTFFYKEPPPWVKTTSTMDFDRLQEARSTQEISGPVHCALLQRKECTEIERSDSRAASGDGQTVQGRSAGQ